MRHSDKDISKSPKDRGAGAGSGRGFAVFLMWAVPLLLLVPNIVLSFTELRYPTAVKLANVLIPGGVYLLLLSWGKNVGRTVLLMIPVMVLCAFQIVLLYLYGESIIAIDMFLNVVTTSMGEAMELLSNLTVAIAAVIVLYLPAIACGVAAMLRHAYTGPTSRRGARMTGAIILVAGVAALGSVWLTGGRARPSRVIFPANVVSNMVSALARTARTAAYPETSAAYSYNARSTRPADVGEVCVMVVGETSRADNWQLAGYSRPTNPRLSAREGVVAFTKALSESNTTHKSVPLMLSGLTSEDYGDSIYSVRGVVSAFREAGFATAWISNQQHNRSFIDYFSSEADAVDYITDDGNPHHDHELCEPLKEFIAGCEHDGCRKIFAVIHTYGSHFNYHERYPREYAVFRPDNSTEASLANREGLINAYDNTIVYTDAVLDSLISILEDCGRPATLLYCSDHGEDIFDDSRNRFLHASPTPTYWQIHVPMVVWMSDSYRRSHPGKYAAAKANSGKDVSTSRSVFHTLLSLADVSSPVFDPRSSVCNPSYIPAPRRYLNDYNEAVPLDDSGFRRCDMKNLDKRDISTR